MRLFLVLELGSEGIRRVCKHARVRRKVACPEGLQARQTALALRIMKTLLRGDAAIRASTSLSTSRGRSGLRNWLLWQHRHVSRLYKFLWSMRMRHQMRLGRRVVTSWTSQALPSGSLKAQNEP
jgi:hypothetical protein